MNPTSSFSAGKAALFAFIPGMGAVYNRQYDKAVAHFGIFAALCVFADEVDILGLAAFVFYVFSIIDAYRSCQALSRQRQADAMQDHQMNLPLWGGALVCVGLLFFLNNLGVVSLRQLARHSWPFLFVGAGLYLIFQYYTSGASQQGTPEAPSAGPPSAASAVAPAKPAVPPTAPSPTVPPPGTVENEGQE